MKRKNATSKLRELERQVFAAAFVRSLEDRHARGVTPRARHEAEVTGGNVVQLWERDCAYIAISDAEGTVELFRIGLAEHAKDSAKDRAETRRVHRQAAKRRGRERKPS